MPKSKTSKDIEQDLHAELARLKNELAEARQTLSAIGRGEIDALVVTGADGEAIYNVISAENLADSLLEQSAEIIVVCNSNNKIVRASTASVCTLGRNIVGHQFEEALVLYKGADPAQRVPMDFAELINAGGAKGLTVHLYDNQNVPRYFLMSARALNQSGGRSGGSIVTLTDISDRVKREEEQRALYDKESEARKRAEDASRIKDEFLATISHELRTPLTAMVGWTRILLTTKLDEATARRGYEVIDRNVKAQTRLIEDLLDVTRINNGRLQLDMKVVDLVAIVKQSIESMQHAAAGKRIALKFFTDSMVCLVSADPSRIQQVMGNLIANAIKFSQNDSEVQIRLSEDNGKAIVSVKDHGSGIAPEFLPSVFERFTQASATQTRTSGLGLGLSIVKSLIEMHNGQVKAHSDGSGLGAEFSFVLPVYNTQDDGVDAGRSISEDQGLLGKKILVLEDDPDTREMIALVLRQQGAEVSVAENVNEALQNFKSDVPDLCISDLGLPERDGYQFIAEVRQLSREQGGEIPVVAVTAFARPEDKRRALAAGFNAYLAKPVDIRHVIETVQAL